MKRKIICSLLPLVLLLSSCYTDSTNPRILEVEQAIDAIGVVSSESGEVIENAKSLYDGLMTDEQERVNNYALLLEAELSYQSITFKQQIKEEKANLTKQDSYNKLKNIVDLCSQGMEDVKGALDLFVYGYEFETHLTELAWQMDTLTLRDITYAGENIGVSNSDLNNLSKRLSVVDKALQERGIYEKIDELLKSVQEDIEKVNKMGVATDFLETYYDDVVEYYEFLKGNYKSIITDGGSIVDQINLDLRISEYEYDLLCSDIAASMSLFYSESDYE